MRLYAAFTLPHTETHRVFAPPASILHGATSGHLYMLDILAAVLGTGGILLMAGYAALCERI